MPRAQPLARPTHRLHRLGLLHASRDCCRPVTCDARDASEAGGTLPQSLFLEREVQYSEMTPRPSCVRSATCSRKDLQGFRTIPQPGLRSSLFCKRDRTPGPRRKYFHRAKIHFHSLHKTKITHAQQYGVIHGIGLAGVAAVSRGFTHA